MLRPWSFLLIATRIPRAIYSFCRGRVLVLFTVGIPAAYSTPIYSTLVMTVIIYGKMSSWTAQLCLIYSSVHVVNTRLPSHQIIKSKRRRRSPRVSSSGCIKLLFNLCQIFKHLAILVNGKKVVCFWNIICIKDLHYSVNEMQNFL